MAADMIRLAGTVDALLDAQVLSGVYERTHRLARAFGRQYLERSGHPALAFVYQNWPLVADQIRICPFRAAVLIMHILALGGAGPGTIAEYGVSSGGSLALMCLAAKRFSLALRFVGFDTFRGLPKPDEQHDPGYTQGQFAASREVPQRLLKELGIDMSLVALIEGDIRYTSTSIFYDSIMLAHLDLDLFEPSLFAIRQLRDLSSRPILVIDDVFDNSGGVRRAVSMEDLNAYAGPTGQAIHCGIGECCYDELWKCYADFLGDCKTALPPDERAPVVEMLRLLNAVTQQAESRHRAEAAPA